MNLKNFYNEKTILVTGGTGSIGSEIVRKLIDLNPAAIRVFDNNETALFDLEQELNSVKIRTFMGDIRDQERLERAFENVDIVFHAAALKHVALCEYNPFDSVKTNVLGTQNILNAALDRNVKKVIMISTDKAVNPINVMGATKLLAERLTMSANNYRGDRDTIFSCVRFGNVLDSRGSVVPIFRKQIKAGGPVTITEQEMTRFVMSIPEAVELILKSGQIADGKEIFILKMPALNIVDLAEVMIEYLGPKYGYDPEEIKIEFIGKRFGEKMYEELMTDDERQYVIDNGEIFVLNTDNSINKDEIYDFNSHTATKLSKEEIKVLISELGL